MVGDNLVHEIEEFDASPRFVVASTVARVRLDKKATSIPLIVVLGVRADGQKVLLAIKSMGGESEAAWRALLDDLV
jgi:putative transposase